MALGRYFAKYPSKWSPTLPHPFLSIFARLPQPVLTAFVDLSCCCFCLAFIFIRRGTACNSSIVCCFFRPSMIEAARHRAIFPRVFSPSQPCDWSTAALIEDHQNCLLPFAFLAACFRPMFHEATPSPHVRATCPSTAVLRSTAASFLPFC